MSGSAHNTGCTVVRNNFTKVTDFSPKINSFNPASGTAGTLVSVQGTDLLLVKAITIGGQAAIIVSNTGSVLVGMVMPGAVTGPILLNGQPSSSLADFSVSSKHLPFSAQGSKLTAADNVQAAEGSSVAVSADGNTMIAGGPGDHGGLGAAFIYTRVAGIWTQQGTKLVGSGAVGNSRQGNAVSINADGTTVLVGGFKDNAGTGAAWVFTRSGQNWIQQGTKLTGSDMNGNAWMGQSVSISADGNTALIGGGYDHNAQGAAWIYNRKNGIWSQNGAKLSGSAGVGSSLQGKSVALSADGAIAVLGGFNDNAGIGAAWIFSLNAGIWMQQGQKLIGNGYSGTNIEQGWSVALNADGSRLVVGGRADSFNIGASWIFSRSGTSWTQDGMKLVANDNTGQSEQASSVAMSADGNTAIIGGLADNNGIGASWIFIREEGFWIQQGLKFIGAGSSQAALQGNSVAISADGGTAFSGGFVDNNSMGASWAYTAALAPVLPVVKVIPVIPPAIPVVVVPVVPVVVTIPTVPVVVAPVPVVIPVLPVVVVVPPVPMIVPPVPVVPEVVIIPVTPAVVVVPSVIPVPVTPVADTKPVLPPVPPDPAMPAVIPPVLKKLNSENQQSSPRTSFKVPVATNLVSPNGDGKNDTWVVKDISGYPNNKVTIFDFTGRIVYSKAGYANDWAGTRQGVPLAEGTYYYLVDYGNGSALGKGFVTVLRTR